MSNDIQFGIRITGESTNATGAIKATRDELDKLSTTSRSVASQYSGITTASEKAAASARLETGEYKKLDTQLISLLSRLDPVYASTRNLDSANELLRRGLESGVLTQSQYESGLINLEKGFGAAAAGAEKSAFATAGARRELIVLGHEAMQGNFSRMPGSFMVLAERVGATSLLFNPLTLAIMAAGSAAVVMGKAFYDGTESAKEMNNALALSGGYAGLTRGAMVELAQDISATSTLTIGVSKQLVTELVKSGQIGAQSISGVARLADDLANATGQDIEKITPQLVRMFEDPLKGAQELNKSTHSITVEEMERIKTLVELGRVSEAQVLLTEKWTAILPHHKDQIGLIGGAWESAKKAVSEYWGILSAKVSGTETIEKQISDLDAFISNQKKHGAKDSELEVLNARLKGLRDQKKLTDEIALGDANIAALNESQNTAQNLVEQVSHLSAIKKLKNEIAQIEGNAANSPEKADALRLLKKQLADMQDPLKGKKPEFLSQDEELGKKQLNEELSAVSKVSKAYEEFHGVLDKVNGVEKTQSMLLQEKLNNMDTLDPQYRGELQAIVDMTAAQEALNEATKQNNEMMQLTQQYDSQAQAQASAVATSYTKILQETEDLNTSMISSDRMRAAEQLRIEHDRRTQAISMMEAEQADKDLLIEAENARYAAAMDASNTKLLKSKDLGKELGMTFSSAFENAVIGGQKFSKVLQSLGQDIEKLILRKTVTEPLTAGIGGAIDKISGGFSDWFSNLFSANADGGVYSSPGLSAYSGQVVSQPTVFPFANGIGLMGEAGPEAILPLTRGSNGKLGVNASGGNNAAVNLTVNLIESPGNGGKVQQHNDGNGGLTLEIMVEKIEAVMGRNISRGAGLAPTMERQYGLNRAVGSMS